MIQYDTIQFCQKDLASFFTMRRWFTSTHFQDSDEQYKIDADDAISTAANLTDLQKMQAELFDVKFPFIQPSLNLVCKNCSIVSHRFI